jgi:tRNA dimethylallyltransferase
MVTGRIKPSGAPPDFELRAELEQLSIKELQEKLKGINKEEFSAIDQNNPARLVRAIEKNLSSKKQEAPLKYLKKTQFEFVGLTADRKILYKRADDWLEEVWGGGLLPETQNLLKSAFKDSPKLKGIVYKTAAAFIKGELPEKEAKQQTKYDLHAYIRRQQTYFKKMPDIKWVSIEQDNKLQKVYNIVDG